MPQRCARCSLRALPPETSQLAQNQRLALLEAFYIAPRRAHLLTYLLVIGALCAINLATDARYLWFLWPADGWGIGLISHAVNTFAFSDRVLENMTDRELRHQRAGSHRSH